MLERTVLERIPRDGVEPEALAQAMELTRGFDRRSCCGFCAGEDKLFDGIRESFFCKRGRDHVGLLFDLIARVAHRDAQPAFSEHEHIICLVAEDSKLIHGNVEVALESLDHYALVG